jgi:hypothetical protein
MRKDSCEIFVRVKLKGKLQANDSVRYIWDKVQLILDAKIHRARQVRMMIGLLILDQIRRNALRSIAEDHLLIGWIQLKCTLEYERRII